MAKKVTTLFDGFDGSKKKGSDDDKKEQGQAFYVGGSEKSGQQVIGPPRDRHSSSGSDDSSGHPSAGGLFERVVNQAQAAGARMVDPREDERDQSPGRRPFAGTGRRLGSDVTGDMPSQPVPGPSHPTQPKKVRVVLKLWRNGYSIDNGELQPLNTPQAKIFFERIASGRIPEEILAAHPGAAVDLDVERHDNEEYVKPKEPIKPFTGTGRALGGISPAGPSHAMDEDEAVLEFVKNAGPAGEPKVDLKPGQPTAKITVRLFDGTRITVVMNESHTLMDLRECIVRARPEYNVQPFAFVAGYPPKPVDDESVTLKDAGLLGALVNLKKSG